MKKILVTGCNGQLGKAVNQEYKNDDVELLNTDVGDLDITDIEKVVRFVKENTPDVIINCAAHTNVDLCETQKELAYKINAIGPKNLSIAASQVGAKIIHISTDYVFDGTAMTPYKEFDSTAPTGVYGFTKLEGERFVKQFADKFFIIRTAWLYGEGRNFVNSMMKLGRENGEVNVVADQMGTPTSAKELARLIHVLEPTNNFGVFHGTCEGYCSWADFAERIFEYAGIDAKVNRLRTDEYPTPVKRPAFSVLDNYMLSLTTDFKFAKWEDALKEYFDELN